MLKKSEAASAPNLTRLQLSRYEIEQRRRRYIVIGSVIVGLVTLGLIAAAVLQLTVIEPGRTVASVGGQSIPVRDLQKRMQLTQNSVAGNAAQLSQQISQIRQSGDPSSDFLVSFYQQQLQNIVQQGTAEGIAQSAYQSMVDDLLVRQEAARRGVTVSAQDVEVELAKSIGYFGATLTPFPTDTAQPTVVVSGTAVVAPTSEPRLQPTSISSDTYRYELSKRVANLAPLNYTEQDMRYFVEGDLYRTRLQEKLGEEVSTTAPHYEFQFLRFNVITDAVKAADRLAKKEIRFDALITETNQITQPLAIGNGEKVDWISEDRVRQQYGPEVLDLLSYKSIGAPTPIVTSSVTGGVYLLVPLGRETRPLAEDELTSKKRDRYDTWLNAAREDTTVVKKEAEPTEFILPVVRTGAAQFMQLYGSSALPGVP